MVTLSNFDLCCGRPNAVKLAVARTIVYLEPAVESGDSDRAS